MLILNSKFRIPKLKQNCVANFRPFVVVFAIAALPLPRVSFAQTNPNEKAADTWQDSKIPRDALTTVREDYLAKRREVERVRLEELHKRARLAASRGGVPGDVALHLELRLIVEDGMSLRDLEIVSDDGERRRIVVDESSDRPQWYDVQFFQLQRGLRGFRFVARALVPALFLPFHGGVSLTPAETYVPLLIEKNSQSNRALVYFRSRGWVADRFDIEVNFL